MDTMPSNLTPIATYDQQTLDLAEYTANDFYGWEINQETFVLQAATQDAHEFLRTTSLAQAYKGCLIVPATALDTVFEALDNLELVIRLIA